MPYSDYDWSEHLDRIGYTKQTRVYKKKTIDTVAGWRAYDYGSATVRSVSIESIYEAYYESKSYEEY